jgi:hypothetical protein
MNSLRPVALILCILFVAVMGCRGGAPIYQVKDAPVQTATGKQPSLEDVQKAIIAAGVGLNWQMVVAKPGEIIGTLNVRSHQAVVLIPYTTYNAERQTIHENYSGWIQRLDGAIRARLTAAGM